MTIAPRFALASLVLLSVAACAPATDKPAAVVTGEWAVDSDASSLSYVSIKSGNVAEANTFTSLSGTVSEAGAAEVIIDLSSLETKVDIRNERMRDLFFEVADHPNATVTATIDPAAFDALAVGDTIALPLKATLSVKGVDAPVDTQVFVTRTAEDGVLVSSTEPVIVYADALELTEGLATLQELAGLPSITPVVPVTFSIAFKR